MLGCRTVGAGQAPALPSHEPAARNVAMILRMPVRDLDRSTADLKPLLDEMREVVRSSSPALTRHAGHLNRPGVIFNYAYYTALVRQRLAPDSVILDWGGQYGHVSKLLRSSFPNVICYVPDRTEYEVEYYHRKFGVDDIVKFGPGYGSAAIDLADASVDAVISSGVLEHTREHGVSEQDSLREIWRVLRPGGSFFIWNLPRKWGSVELLNTVLRRSFHQYKYRGRDITKLLTEAGFEVELFDRHELLNLSSRNALGKLIGDVRAWTADYYFSKAFLGGAFAQHFTIVARKPTS
jgi:ubiquinone/menaquinone biosynthesis C-methylase UbiE